MGEWKKKKHPGKRPCQIIFILLPRKLLGYVHAITKCQAHSKETNLFTIIYFCGVIRLDCQFCATSYSYSCSCFPFAKPITLTFLGTAHFHSDIKLVGLFPKKYAQDFDIARLNWVLSKSKENISCRFSQRGFHQCVSKVTNCGMISRTLKQLPLLFICCCMPPAWWENVGDLWSPVSQNSQSQVHFPSPPALLSIQMGETFQTQTKTELFNSGFLKKTNIPRRQQPIWTICKI